jgi:hypothetical protein
MGLFGVNLPLLYGKGGTRAFMRLQQEIMKNLTDHTLFAWELETSDDDCEKLLLSSSALLPLSGVPASSHTHFETPGRSCLVEKPCRLSSTVNGANHPYSLTP